MNLDFKPCPFCGSAVELEPRSNGSSRHNFIRDYGLSCPSCNFEFGLASIEFDLDENLELKIIKENISDIQKIWNTRHV